MPRWLPIIISILIGLTIGLVYGWIINPVQYTDITPEALRIDYQTDYVLMVAEAYNAEQDPALAAKRLAVLGSKQPALIVENSYSYAKQTSYSTEDLTLMQELVIALQTWQPIPGTSVP